MSYYFAILLEILIQIGFLYALTALGNKLIRRGFHFIHQTQQDDGNRLGRRIGAAERVLLFMGILLNQWSVVTVVIALKALARFKELDDKSFAEYFLVGSLWSLIYCFSASLLYLRFIGFFSAERINRIANWLG